jgi:hypothetical protein
LKRRNREGAKSAKADAKKKERRAIATDGAPMNTDKKESCLESVFIGAPSVA